MLTETILNQYAKKVFVEHFGKEFTGKVIWSKKMKNIAGNCRSDGRIALNFFYYERYGQEEILKVLRHELVHHYCFAEIGRHTHSDPLFVSFLNQVGGDQKGKPMPVTGYIYECPCCSRNWTFRKKMEKRKLSCQDCGNGSYNKEYKIRFVKEITIEPELQECG
jgi:SprT-like protein